MAKTAVVNRRRRRRKSNPKKKRRRNYGAAQANPPKRRRRRRNPLPARRRSSGGGRRIANPSRPFDLDQIMEVLPAATGGVWLGRWATKLAGDFEPNDKGIPEPGFKHAIAIALAASVGGDMVGNLMGSSAAGERAYIACLGYGGDLFLRRRFFRDSEFVEKNLNLSGIGNPDDDDEYEYVYDYEDPGADTVSGFSQTSPLGNVNSYTDAVGNRYVMTNRGWQLAGVGQSQSDYVVGPDGTLYQLSGGVGAGTYPPDYANVMEAAGVGGFASQSRLGMAPARNSEGNSFGYAR